MLQAHASKTQQGDFKNPCERNCCLDDHEVCLGCGRSMVEIISWSQLSTAEKEKVMVEAYKRKNDRVHW